MVEERPSIFQRAVTVLRGAMSRAIHVADATERRVMVEGGLNEADHWLAKLADLPAQERDVSLRAHDIDPAGIQEWTEAEWSDPEARLRKIESDVRSWLDERQLSASNHESHLAAISSVSESYAEAHLAVNFAAWEAEYDADVDLPEGNMEGAGPDDWPTIELSEHPIFALTDADLAHGRLTTALAEIADAVEAGERPAFRTAEMADAFRQDLEDHYGEGAVARMRDGDWSYLAPDMTDAHRRQLAAVGATLAIEGTISKDASIQQPSSQTALEAVHDGDTTLDL